MTEAGGPNERWADPIARQGDSKRLGTQRRAASAARDDPRQLPGVALALILVVIVQNHRRSTDLAGQRLDLLGELLKLQGGVVVVEPLSRGRQALLIPRLTVAAV